MRRALIWLAVVIFAAQSSARGNSTSGEFRYPPVGTDVVTTGDTYRVESVNGFDAVMRNLRTGNRFGVHALVLAGSSVGNVLQYDRAAPESLWPLSVGKSTSFDAHREHQVWQVEVSVTGTERVVVPAGTFDTFVIQKRERGIGHNSYRGTTTYWYAPIVGSPVKYEQVVESQNNRIAWELKQLAYPAGYVAPQEAQKKQVPTTTPTVRPPGTEQPESADPVERLEQLKRLYDRKLITPDEFNAKRRAILDSL